ncbi:MAG: hypothetical protein JW951_08885 [Lentisphaerae bacterium]|nr:hypothetical protein [Lentisphaerota bacterium]
MKKRDPFDFWYAVNNTEIVRLPSRHLETFGTTVLNYHLVSELMDTVDQVRVRQGRMLASQPKIITPEAYSRTLLEGFSEEAEKYVDWLREHEKEIRILQYGYRLKQESFSEHVITDNVEAVTERVKEDVESRNDPLAAVVVGVDEPWDVCLIKLFWEVIQGSARTNIREMARRSLFNDEQGIPRGVRQDLEQEFHAAARDPGLIAPLGRKLQNYGLFEEYQDRFFSLVKSHKR